MPIKQRYERARPITDLEPHPDNPRRGDIPAIQESIDAHGFYGAILVQKSTGRIIAGEHRWRAAQAEGLDTVPAVVIDCDDDQARRIMLADNRTSDAGGYDDSIRAALLADFNNLTGTGYTDDDLAALLADTDTSGFLPISKDEQPRLDQRAPLQCPDCSYEWRVGPGGEIEPV